MHGYRFVEHVGEIELALEAGSEAGLYREAAHAFRKLVDGVPPAGAACDRLVELRSGEPARLLADWLNELVFLAEVEAFVPLRVRELDLDAGGLRARLDGVRGRPRHLVKAATLHDLELEHEGEVWRARVVLDV
jgi:SHS2 domain-containing protein